MVEFVATMSRHRGGPVLVGGVADRAARELGRVGQSGGQRQGTAIAPPKRAARPPVRPSRVAEANRQTIGLGVGLSSQWSPAESGSIPERLSSVRTYAGARDYLVYQYRTRPASRFTSRFPLQYRTRPASRFHVPLPASSRFPSRFPLLPAVLASGIPRSPAKTCDGMRPYANRVPGAKIPWIIGLRGLPRWPWVGS